MTAVQRLLAASILVAVASIVFAAVRLATSGNKASTAPQAPTRASSPAALGRRARRRRLRRLRRRARCAPTASGSRWACPRLGAVRILARVGDEIRLTVSSLGRRGRRHRRRLRPARARQPRAARAAALRHVAERLLRRRAPDLHGVKVADMEVSADPAARARRPHPRRPDLRGPGADPDRLRRGDHGARPCPRAPRGSRAQLLNRRCVPRVGRAWAHGLEAARPRGGHARAGAAPRGRRRPRRAGASRSSTSRGARPARTRRRPTPGLARAPRARRLPGLPGGRGPRRRRRGGARARTASSLRARTPRARSPARRRARPRRPDVVGAEARARRRRHAQPAHQRLCAVMTGAHADVLAVDELGDVVRVHALDRERDHSAALLHVPGPHDAARPAARRAVRARNG